MCSGNIEKKLSIPRIFEYVRHCENVERRDSSGNTIIIAIRSGFRLKTIDRKSFSPKRAASRVFFGSSFFARVNTVILCTYVLYLHFDAFYFDSPSFGRFVQRKLRSKIDHEIRVGIDYRRECKVERSRSGNQPALYSKWLRGRSRSRVTAECPKHYAGSFELEVESNGERWPHSPQIWSRYTRDSTPPHPPIL